MHEVTNRAGRFVTSSARFAIPTARFVTPTARFVTPHDSLPQLHNSLPRTIRYPNCTICYDSLPHEVTNRACRAEGYDPKRQQALGVFIGGCFRRWF